MTLKKLKIKLISWFMSTNLYSYLLLKKIPFIRFAMYYTDIRGNFYHNGYNLLKEGDFLGTIDYKKLTGLLIPKVTGGVLSHAAYCFAKRDPYEPNKEYGRIMPTLGHGCGLEIAEMTHLDFTFSDFFDICKEADRVIIFRCEDYDPAFVTRMNKEVLDFRKAKYDTQFKFEKMYTPVEDSLEFLYCSELIYAADKNASLGEGRIKADTSDFMGLGREYISPDGLLTAENVICVWDSKVEFTGLTGPQIAERIWGK